MEPTLIPSPSHGPLDFTFSSGWTEFVTHNRIVKGDILVFSKLTANLLKFRVYMFNFKKLPIDALPQTYPSMTRHDVDAEEEDLMMPCISRLVPPLHQKKVVKQQIRATLFQ